MLDIFILCSNNVSNSLEFIVCWIQVLMKFTSTLIVDNNVEMINYFLNTYWDVITSY